MSRSIPAQKGQSSMHGAVSIMEVLVRGTHPERILRPGVIGAIALGYCVDASLSLGFAISGAVAYAVPLTYLAAGLAACALFHWLAVRARHCGTGDSHLALPLCVVSIAIDLLYIALVPQIAVCFLAVMLGIVGLGSMYVSERQSFLTWIGVSLSVLLLLVRSHGTSWIPPQSVANWALMFGCFVLTSGRCILLGVYGRALRMRQQEQSQELTE